jgi:alpha-methylacyl-CoA racemase
VHAHLVLPKGTSTLFAPMLGRAPGADGNLLNGGLTCSNLYNTADIRQLAVAARELKFLKAECEVFERPDWIDRHWERGQMPGTKWNNALREEVAVSAWSFLNGRGLSRDC